MNRIAEELDAKLNELDPVQANNLIMLVRRAIEQVAQIENPDESVWPDGYFEQTAGSFADEPLERFPQGEATARDSW
jgi:predicted transcriptional regulator